MSAIEDLNRKAVELQQEVWKDTASWQENFSKAIEILESALEIDSNNLITLTNLGAAYCDSGQHQKAKRHLEKAIRLGSLDKNTHFNLGVACINTRSEYMPHFDRARELKSSDKTWEAYFDPHAH